MASTNEGTDDRRYLTNDDDNAVPGNKRKCSRRCCCIVTVIILLIISVILNIGLGIFYRYKNEIFYSVINKELSLTKDSLLTSKWLHLAPENNDIYYFNVSNPHEVQHKGATPVVHEIGPFCYLKNRDNDNVYWNEDETLLTYRRTLRFDDKVNDSISDPYTTRITTLNIPLIGMLQLLENIESNPKYKDWKLVLDAIFRTGDWINELLGIEPLFITKTVDELSWGYEDPLFKLIHELDPTLLPQANFSLQSRNKVYTYNVVYTGKNDSSLRSKLYVWNGLTEISEWNSPTARMINGTDATVFHTNISRDETLDSFNDDFKRSAYLTYTNDEYVNGLLSYRYVFAKQELNTSTMDPGFYPNGPSGLFNLSAVQPFNLPLFVSKPHFLDADPGYVDNVTGLHPNITEHDSFIDIEPITGISIKAAKKIQVNIELKKKREYKQLRDLNDLTMFPIFYIVNSGGIDDEQSKKLKNTLENSQDSLNYGIPVLIGLTGFVAVSSFLCLTICISVKIRNNYKRRRTRRGTVNENTSLLSSQ